MNNRSKTNKNDLPVYITEEHNNVVPFIHRAIASKKLPFTGVPIVHLDSHPDLLISPSLLADTVFKPNDLYSSVSIENWLMPQVFAKHVNPVIWVKPPWANQIKASSLKFLIGKCTHSGLLRVSSKENYFLTDGLYRHKDNLTDASDVHLLVLELRPEKWAELDVSYEESKANGCTESISSQFSSYQEWTGLLQDQVQDKAYILDIDLDFFSTQNPFKDLLSSEAEEAVRRLYYSSSLSQLSEEALDTAMTEREKQLAVLEEIWKCAEKFEEEIGNRENLSDFTQQTDALMELIESNGEHFKELPEDQQNDIRLITNHVLERLGEVTFVQVHDFGCTLDDTELPHHVSTEKQIEALSTAFSQVLEKLCCPALVTIARSSVDEYCPPSCVEQIERMVLQLLEKHFGKLHITKDFG